MKGAFLINPKKEDVVAEKWRKVIDIKTDSLETNILSLSGGNQQKVLFARCLESKSPIVLMDDPTRGVDVGTKEEIYKLITRGEAKRDAVSSGIRRKWKSSSTATRIYVFKSGKILAKLAGAEVDGKRNPESLVLGRRKRKNETVERNQISVRNAHGGWKDTMPIVSILVVLIPIIIIRPRVMNYNGLQLLLNMAVPISPRDHRPDVRPGDRRNRFLPREPRQPGDLRRGHGHPA